MSARHSVLLCVGDSEAEDAGLSKDVPALRAAAEFPGFRVSCGGVSSQPPGDSECRAVVILSGATNDPRPTLQHFRRQFPTAFVILFGAKVAGHALARLQAFAAGAHMVSNQVPSVQEALSRVAQMGRGGGDLACPSCGLGGLTEDELHLHHPLYHSCQPNDSALCPICNMSTTHKRKAWQNNFPWHLHNQHGPLEEREPKTAPFAAFAWVVCRRSDGRFLMVNEPAGISRGAPRYWLPAGRVDVGESLIVAAQRETLEEGGVAVRITGVLCFMVAGLKYPEPPTPRIVFLAEPEVADAVPKSVPDWESVGALWVEAPEVLALNKDDFRSPDPAWLFPEVASGERPALSVDTDAFRAFDALVARCTRGEEMRETEAFRSAWAVLRKAYPPESFIEH